MKAAKVERDRLRSTVTRVDSEQLIRESQFQKAELKRQKQYWKDHLASLQAEVEVFETEIRTQDPFGCPSTMAFQTIPHVERPRGGTGFVQLV